MYVKNNWRKCARKKEKKKGNQNYIIRLSRFEKRHFEKVWNQL